MRGNITARRGRRSWRLKFDVDTIGARRICYVTVKGTRRDACRLSLARLLHEVNTGVAVDHQKSWSETM